MPKRAIPVALLGLLLLAPTGAAAAKAAPVCVRSSHFQVVHAARENAVGSDILVQRLTPGQSRACKFQRRTGDYSVGGPNDANYVLGLTGGVLVLDQGTGPNRTLSLFDLEARRVLIDRRYDDEAPVKIEPAQVVFSAIIGPGKPELCPQYKELTANGLSTALVQDMTIALPSREVRMSGTVRCIGQQ